MKFPDRYSLWFLVPGIALTLASVYIPLSYIHKQVFWTETEAVITERAERNVAGDVEVLYRMQYSDDAGTVHQIQVDSENHFSEGKDSDHARLLYDPANTANFELVNPGRYLLILFFPFGVLLAYLGWPERASK